MPKSDGKHLKTALTTQKKRGYKSSRKFLKIYDNPIGRTCNRFRSTGVSLFVLRTQRNPSC